MQLVDIVLTPALSGSLAPFPPVGVWRSWERPIATARALPADAAPLGVLKCAVLGSGGPRAASACERPDTNRVRSLLTAPIAAKASGHGPQTDHLTSARVGSQASRSLRKAASRSPIREATAPMPVAPPVTPVVAVPAPPVALGRSSTLPTKRPAGFSIC